MKAIGTRGHVSRVFKRMLVLLIVVVALSVVTEAAKDSGDGRIGVTASVFDPFGMVRVASLSGSEPGIPHFRRPNIKIPPRPTCASPHKPGNGPPNPFPGNAFGGNGPTWSLGKAPWM